MAFMTDETMDEIAADYDEEASRVMTGDSDRERYVSEKDMQDCVHDNGVWTDEFSAWDHRSTFECADCDYVLEV
jgi:hypothetical protein